jgi:hypothetical protein
MQVGLDIHDKHSLEILSRFRNKKGRKNQETKQETKKKETFRGKTKRPWHTSMPGRKKHYNYYALKSFSLAL